MIRRKASTSYHPAELAMSLSLLLDGATILLHLDTDDIVWLEKEFMRVRKGYLPWIKQYFELVTIDATWRCKKCFSEIEGKAEFGGAIFQMFTHLKEQHPETMEFIIEYKDPRLKK